MAYLDSIISSVNESAENPAEESEKKENPSGNNTPPDKTGEGKEKPEDKGKETPPKKNRDITAIYSKEFLEKYGKK